VTSVALREVPITSMAGIVGKSCFRKTSVGTEKCRPKGEEKKSLDERTKGSQIDGGDFSLEEGGPELPRFRGEREKGVVN